MTLRVTNVPQPAAGQEWTFAIPGQYTYDVRAVVATYRAQDPSSTFPMLDASPNGNDGVYTGPDVPAGLQTPGLIVGDDCVTLGPASAAPRYLSPHVGNVGAGGGPFNLFNAFAFEQWVQFPGNVGVDCNVVIAETGGAVERMYLQISTGAIFGMEFGLGVPLWSYRTAPGTFPLDGNVHQIAAMWNTVDAAIYVDGVEVPSVIAGAVGGRDVNDANVLYGGTSGGAALRRGLLDEASVWESGFDATQIADHYAAGLAGFATYSAVILGDGPAGYYHLDDGVPVTPAQRYTGLVVTDGTHVLAVYTSGELSSLTGPVTFVWTPATSNVVIAGARYTIGVPPLILPAGYTLGSGTPAIGASDQWSDIAIWWDDALSGQPGYGAYDKYANVLLIP